MRLEKLKKAYKAACDLSLRLVEPRSSDVNQTSTPSIPVVNNANPSPIIVKKRSRMSSDFLGGFAAWLGLFAGISTLAAAFFAVFAWRAARRESKAATDALEKYKADAGQMIADANVRAAEANERTAQVQRKLGGRYVSQQEASVFVEAMKDCPKIGEVYIIPDDRGDIEERGFVYSLARTLQAAGLNPLHRADWPMQMNLLTGERKPTITGVAIMFDSTNTELRRKLMRLTEAFRSIGIYAPCLTTQQPSLTPKNGCVILVGHKPAPDFGPAW